MYLEPNNTCWTLVLSTVQVRENPQQTFPFMVEGGFLQVPFDEQEGQKGRLEGQRRPLKWSAIRQFIFAKEKNCGPCFIDQILFYQTKEMLELLDTIYH